MTEKLGEPTESREPLASVRFEREVQPENLIHMMQEAGSELASRTFPDEHSAQAAGYAFCQEWEERVDACKELTTVSMRAEGNMMYVANSVYKKDGNGNITISYLQDKPVKELPPMSTRHFQYRRVFHSIGGMRTSDEYNITPFIVGKDMDASHQAHDIRMGFPLTSVFFQVGVMVPCLKDVEIESVNLRKERRHLTAKANLHAYTGLYPDIKNDLEKIEKEIHEAEGRGNLLQHIDALRAIGQIGIKFSSLGFKYEDALNCAIATTLGEDKKLNINGSIYALSAAQELMHYPDQTIDGKLVNVISNPPMLPDMKGPTLALQSLPLSENEQARTYYAPLSEINSVRF